MSSDLNAARATIEKRIASFWTRTPISWAGMNFTPPEGRWIQVAILWGDGFESTFGGDEVGTNEVIGVVNVNLFDRPGAGFGELYVLVDVVRDLFTRIDVDNVRFGVPSGPKPAAEPRNGWLQVTVDVPFVVEDTL